MGLHPPRHPPHTKAKNKPTNPTKPQTGCLVVFQGQWSMCHNLPREYEVITGSITEIWTCPVDKHVAGIDHRVLSPSFGDGPKLGISQ